MSTPSTFGYRLTQEMTPLGGKNAPIQPPSYSGGEFAVSEAKDGSKSVIINNIGAEAHAMSDAMHAALGDDAPGIFVDVIDEKALDKEIKKDRKWVRVRSVTRAAGSGELLFSGIMTTLVAQ